MPVTITLTLIGLVIVAAGLFWGRRYIRGTEAAAHARIDAVTARLEERLEHRQKEAEALRAELSDWRAAKDELDGKHQVLTQQYARAEAGLEAKKEEIAGLKQQVAKAESAMEELRDAKGGLAEKVAMAQTQLEEERKAAKEKMAMLDKAEEQFKDTFDALSRKALDSNNTTFMELAKSAMEQFTSRADATVEKRKQALDALVNPLSTSLEQVNTHIQKLEKERQGAYASLREQVQAMSETQVQLRKEAGNLVQALRKPTVRGRWGEMQLKRVVEIGVDPL